MKLQDLVRGFPITTLVEGGDDVDVRGVTVDSRRVGPGVVFVACPGATPSSRDGHDFLPQAIQAGAAAVVVQRARGSDVPAGCPSFVVDDPRRAAAWLAERVQGDPSSHLGLVGVTGTNGKTTVTFLLASLFEELGRPAAVLGTLGVGRLSALRPLGFTTPEAEVLSAELKGLVDAGVERVAMEVSSHALATARADGLTFAAAAFTNFTQDHLDFHPTMEAYFEAKARLFEELLPRGAPAVVPATADVPRPAALRPEGRPVVTWGVGAGDVHADRVRVEPAGLRFDLSVHGERFAVASPLIGRHNVDNLVVTAALAVALGEAPAQVATALGAARAAPGRFERVGAGRPVVVVDYAHTPDALERALAACRETSTGRVLVVFGCGGDRDRKKRPLMGAVAARGADVAVFTNDNPRSEAPSSILDAIEEGARGAGMGPLEEDDGSAPGFLRDEDRAAAIARAIGLARDDDMVLVAGKGHEKTMTFADRTVPFDDVAVAAAALAGRAA